MSLLFMFVGQVASMRPAPVPRPSTLKAKPFFTPTSTFKGTPNVTVDAVIVAADVSCSTRMAVSGILRFGTPSISRLYFVTPNRHLDKCRTAWADLSHVSTKLTCVDEQTVLDLRPVRAAAILQKLFPNEKPDFVQMRSHWYLAQLLKLQAFETLPLAEYYTVWEADNIMVRPYTFFSVAGNVRVNLHGTTNYCASTKKLLQSLGPAVPCQGMVSHQMFVHKPVMQGLIKHLCGQRHGTSCSEHILSSLPGQGQNSFLLGMAEYELYNAYGRVVFPKEFTVSAHKYFYRVTPKEWTWGWNSTDGCKRGEITATVDTWDSHLSASENVAVDSLRWPKGECFCERHIVHQQRKLRSTESIMLEYPKTYVGDNNATMRSFSWRM